MDKTLIVKTGATGDVVRTTPLLHVIEGEIHWLTQQYNKAILPTDCRNLTKIFSIENDKDAVQREFYSKIISLEEEDSICSIITSLRFNSITGVFIKDGLVQYTADASRLFDMSLISKLGKRKADEMKFVNTLSYQDMIFEMIGKKFSGQKYWIKQQRYIKKKIGNKIGIETRAGQRWKGKIWLGYEQLAGLLTKRGYEIMFFREKQSLNEYIEDINSCDYIITGDTLAMHIAIALNLPTLAIFTCTSPNEIYGYSILEKITSPKLKESFYKTTPVADSISAIKVDDVFEKCLSMLSI